MEINIKDQQGSIDALPSLKASRLNDALFRFLDIAFSLPAIILLMPLLLCISVGVKLSSPGPVIYKQKRVGKNGQVFVMYKFRSMIKDAELTTGPVLASVDDKRVTTFGRFLRRRRLDELPQLFNVLRGEMSLVGPRPERPYFVDKHNILQGRRLLVKPGITGVAQVKGIYNLTPDKKIQYDTFYIKNKSISFYFYILAKTVVVLFSRKGW